MGHDDRVTTDECCELAIEALEKQIPKKPKIFEVTRFDGALFDIIICGNCAEPFSEYLDWGDLTDSEKLREFTDDIDTECWKHCPKCGNRVDWDDE